MLKPIDRPPVRKIWEDCPIETPLNRTWMRTDTPRYRRAAWLYRVNTGHAGKVPFGPNERAFFAWAAERCAEVGPSKATHDRRRNKFKQFPEVAHDVANALSHLPRSKWMLAIQTAWNDAHQNVGLKIESMRAAYMAS
jgi:hypothetical protein